MMSKRKRVYSAATCTHIKRAWQNIIRHPDNSINNQFSYTRRRQEMSKHGLDCMQTCTVLHRFCWLCVVDKSGGQVWYVNMSAILARYSQLLLQDLSRDLMLISKKTESCRLSMAALQSFTSRHKFYSTPVTFMSQNSNIPLL